MSRPVTDRIRQIRVELESRLRNGPLRPGERFYSNRSLAQKYSISYQTAHRLMLALEKEGLLRRTRSSGTYISGGVRLRHIELCFHPRAQQADSFGSRMLHLLERALQAADLDYRRIWLESPHEIAADVYPILWEAGADGVRFAGPHHFGLILNDRPPAGLRGSYLDSLATDDYSGGAAAAELLQERGLKPRQMAILGGPETDGRSQNRIAGFLSVARKVKVVHAEGWYYEDGLRCAPRLLRDQPQGIFCANDRLAVAVLDTAKDRTDPVPVVVGFDDAPVALARGLTTIAVPWEEIALGAAALAAARIKGDTSPARAQIYAPRPVIRW